MWEARERGEAAGRLCAFAPRSSRRCVALALAVCTCKNSSKSMVPLPSLSMSAIIFLISSFFGSKPSARIATFSSLASIVPGRERSREREAEQRERRARHREPAAAAEDSARRSHLSVVRTAAAAALEYHAREKKGRRHSPFSAKRSRARAAFESALFLFLCAYLSRRYRRGRTPPGSPASAPQ